MNTAFLQDILSRSFLGNSVALYLTSLAIFLGGLVVVMLIHRIGFASIRNMVAKTVIGFDDAIFKIVESSGLPLLYLLAAYFALQPLVLGKTVSRFLVIGGTILATYYAVKALLSLLLIIIEHWWRKKEGEEGSKVIGGIFAGVRLIVWSIALILLLDNLGVKISTLVAGLGITGIAVALASQALLGDLFSYVTIFLDKPFKIGDFIIVGDMLGTVEHIGIKTTRIQSLSGEQLVFCNSDLTSSRIRNFKKMEKRRVVFKFGVIYATTLEQTKKIPPLVKEIIAEIPDTKFDRAHFQKFGDFSLDFEVVYYVIGSDYTKYMDIQQTINFRLKEEFENLGIDFAFPTRTVYLTGEEKAPPSIAS